MNMSSEEENCYYLSRNHSKFPLSLKMDMLLAYKQNWMNKFSNCSKDTGERENGEEKREEKGERVLKMGGSCGTSVRWI